MEDKNILKLFDSEPERALELIYDKYFDYLSREVYFILKDEQDTEDVIQELFLALWKNHSHLKGINYSLKSYLKKSVINKSINKIKKRRYFEDITSELVLLRYREDVEETDHLELENQMKKLIDALPPKCRTVFVLSRYEELKYKEIAKKLDISIKTVENQISKALKILREKIK